MNSEEEMILKKEIIGYLKILSRHLPGETGKTTTKFSQNSR
jgi:hypothetical protein